MVATLKRIHARTGTVALVLALLALVLSAAGAGYAAGQVRTADIQDGAITADKIKKNAVTATKIQKNAVTSAKVKNGSIQASDLLAQEAQHLAKLTNGGEGDCVWLSGELMAPGVGPPTYRLDRDGRVLLSGISVVTSGPGGDGTCDPTDPGQSSDGIAFMLPAGYIPAKTQAVFSLAGYLIIAGPQGTTIAGIPVPPGAVYATNIAMIEGVEFDPVGSKVLAPRTTARGQ